MTNRNMANKGMMFEREVQQANLQYEHRGRALVQKISTPWKVVRQGKAIISAFPEGKSTLDFRGTVKPSLSISFDCKETEDERGLPLSNIDDHQIEYIRKALSMGEITFILCCMKTTDKRYRIAGDEVIQYWDRWKRNKGRRGYNFIPIEAMKEVTSRRGIMLDYLHDIEELIKGDGASEKAI